MRFPRLLALALASLLAACASSADRGEPVANLALAEDALNHRRYALKRLLFSVEESRARQRFEQEITTVAPADRPRRCAR